LTAQVRSWWAAYRCTSGVKVSTGFFGRTPVYAANADMVVAIQALEQGHLGSGYVPTVGGYIGSRRSCPSGIAGKPCQQSGKDCSIHNYCAAVDVEYNYNKNIKARTYESDFSESWFHTVCKYTLAQVKAIEGIKNTTGEQMFKWLGWAIGDFMHWQINVPPTRMTVDWNTVPGGMVVVPEGDDMFCKYGDGFGTADGSEIVRYWQNLVVELGGEVGVIDGKFGSKLVAAVSSILPFSDGQQIFGEEAAEIITQIGAVGSDAGNSLNRGDIVTLT